MSEFMILKTFFSRIEAHTLEMKGFLLDICNKRNYDDWALRVQKHLLDCHDLVAAEGRYHKKCYNSFRLHQVDDKSSISTPGRPVDTTKSANFDQLCEWLELEGELHSLSELREKLILISESEDVYDVKWIKKKLQEKYAEHIIFTTISGKPNVACLLNTASYIINDKWYTDRRQTVADEAERIIKTAAKLILGDIRSAEFDINFYPPNEIIESVERGKEWLPKYLRFFLQHLLKYPLRQVSIGQCIVNAVRPRSCIPPVLFGLGVEVDNIFGSKFLLNELCSLGFSVSPDEVLRYKQSVTENESASNFITEYFPGSFTQWMADNADHNAMTIDGKGSMHAMGSICATTCQDGYIPRQNLRPIQRQKRKRANQVIRGKGIPIIAYIPPENSGLSKVFFKNILELQTPHILPRDVNLDLLWHVSYFSKSLRPNWSGFMTDISVGNYPGKSTVSFLPILDMDPTDYTCIYSVLVFISEQAKNLQIETPVITFDQPLWLKSLEIVKAKSMQIVLILGGFHMMMSFMGSIGCLMKGSGLNDALQTIYGTNAVEHMISGKAVSRALRGHFLTESALMTKLIRNFITDDIVETVDGLDLSESSDDEVGVGKVDEIEQADETEGVTGTCGEDDELVDDMEEWMRGVESEFGTVNVDQIKILVTTAMSDPNTAVDCVSNSEDMKVLTENLQHLKDELSSVSRTAKLWIQHLYYINVLKLFIRAERTGNWSLHLVAVSKMINLFAATGHINYAKSARIHLQNMLELPTNFPWVYSNFSENGYHTVRRSDRYWAGLWSDLIIEQCLMRSLKSRGGITRGRGITESVLILWVSSMHRCAGIHNAMGNLTGQRHRTSEQHIDLGASRIKRDNSDLKKLIAWFDTHEPFDPSQPLLRSLASGVTATDGDGINCDDAENAGFLIQEKLNNVCIEVASIKRKDQVKSLDILRPGIKIDDDTIHIDPQILFTRLAALLQREDDIIEKFAYELTPEPASLFKDGMMRKSAKSILRNHLLMKIEPSINVTTEVCVVDGGALLHKVSWQQKGIYKNVVDLYINFVKKRYAGFDTVCVVFDGYTDKWSLKSPEHQRRSKTTSANVTISENMKVSSGSKLFLRNEHNKKQFIILLSSGLRRSGYKTVECTGDADVTIAKTAIEYAEGGHDVVVTADDTDILILLIYHWREDLADVFFSTEWKVKNSKTKLLKWWNIGALAMNTTHREHLLFAHAWGGCDTTSATYKKGAYNTKNYYTLD